MAVRISEILQDPIRHPAGYPIQVGFETFFLWNASRCALFEEPSTPNTYSLILSNLSVVPPVFCNNEISKQDGRDHLTIYLITEVCNIIYTIGKYQPTKEIPYRYGPYLSEGILCEYTERITVQIPDYILPAGCYLFIISRNINRPAKCFRSPTPVTIYKPYNFKPGVPITIPASTDLSPLSELGKELLGVTPQPEVEKVEEIQPKPKLSEKHLKYYRIVFSLIFSIFYLPKSDTFGGPSADDILKTKPGIGDWLNRETITSSDNSSVYIENKHFILPCGPHIHPSMSHYTEVQWRPFVILVSEDNLKKKFEKFTGEPLSVRNLVSMLMGAHYTKEEYLCDVQTFTTGAPDVMDYVPMESLSDDLEEGEIFIPSPIACVIFAKVERIIVNLDYIYRIRAYRRVTRFEDKGNPLELLMTGLQNMLK